MYTHMCALYTCTNTHMPKFSPFEFFGLSRCFLSTLGSHPSTPCAVRMCVCVSAHIHTHTLPLTSKNRENTDNTPISPSVKNKPPRQATSALHRLDQPPHPRPPNLMNKLCIHERMYTPCSESVRKCVR